MNIKKRVLLLTFPFLVILLLFFFNTQINKKEIKERFEEITLNEGVTIRNLMETAGIHLVNQGEEKLIEFLDRLYQNEAIIYIGLFENDRLTHLLSDFEGYFPVTSDKEGGRIMDTPVGKIFEISARFGDNNKYRLHIGFNFDFLTDFEKTTTRNFFVVAALFLIPIFFLIVLVYYFDKKFFHKEIELLKEKEEKERFKEMSLLTTEIAHEIKNPLNSIYLSFNVLEKYIQPGTDNEAGYYQEAIKNEIKRINKIIQSYSELSREIRPEIHDLSIEEFMREFSLLVEEEILADGGQLKTTQAGVEKVKTDPNLLKQVLLNLVKNSLEAGARVIDVKWYLQGNWLLVDVSDDGKGIDDLMADSIFKPYISSKTTGMGLGLHISRRLAQALKGDIYLISGSKGNTVFRIRIPYRESQGGLFLRRSIANE